MIFAKDKILAKHAASIESLNNDVDRGQLLLSQSQALINKLKGIIEI